MARAASSDGHRSPGNIRVSAAQEGVAVPAAGRLLRRTEAARLLGVSKSTLRRMEGAELTPVVGPRNVHLFQEEEVRAVVITRRTRIDPQSSTGEVAADAFALFDAGVDVVDAVKQLRVAPEVLEPLYERWARLRAMLVLSAQARSEITTIVLGWDDRSLKNEADIIAFLKKWMMNESIRRCSECSAEMAMFCRACAQRWGLKTVREQLAAERGRKL
jgi:hypothetical protein